MSYRGGRGKTLGRGTFNSNSSQNVKAPKGNFIDIDGSVLEGGGQILRMAACFSALLCKPIHVSKIRAGRAQGGLKAQHLAGLKLIEQLCQGHLTGAFVGSSEIWLQPVKLKGGQFFADPGTAGSITLLIQVALPCILFTEEDSNLLDLRGGTNVAFSPPIEYTHQLLLEHLSKHCGIHVQLDLIKRGFFPKGGGQVLLKTDAKRLESDKIRPIDMEVSGNRNVKSIYVFAWSYPEPLDHLRYTQLIKNLLLQQFNRRNLEINSDQIVIEYNQRSNESRNAASGLWINANVDDFIFGADALPDRTKSLDQSIGETCEFLARNIAEGGAVDEHMQDQLIIFAVLANGRSRIRCGQLTMHTKTAIHLSQLLTQAKIDVHNNGDGTNTIMIDGIGFSL